MPHCCNCLDSLAQPHLGRKKKGEEREGKKKMKKGGISKKLKCSLFCAGMTTNCCMCACARARACVCVLLSNRTFIRRSAPTPNQIDRESQTPRHVLTSSPIKHRPSCSIANSIPVRWKGKRNDSNDSGNVIFDSASVLDDVCPAAPPFLFSFSFSFPFLAVIA